MQLAQQYYKKAVHERKEGESTTVVCVRLHIENLMKLAHLEGILAGAKSKSPEHNRATYELNDLKRRLKL